MQPAATAGPIFRVPIANGKFHGVIINVGPTGRFIVINRVAPSGEVDHRPEIRTASSLNQRKNSAAYATSPRDSTSGLPISNVINNASSSARAVISSNARRRISPRSRGAVPAQPSWAATATSSAATPSAGDASATSAKTSPVDGSCTANTALSVAGVVPPPTHRPFGTSATTAVSRLAIDGLALMGSACQTRGR